MDNGYKIKNFIFDWSGVISNDFLLVFETYRKIFRHYDKPEMTIEEFRSRFRLPYMDFCQEYLGQYSEQELSEIFKKLYTEEKCMPDPIKGVEPVLKELKKQNKKMIVLSSHSFVSREAQRYFPGTAYFQSIYEDIPDKEKAIEQVVEEIGFLPEETVYIGDMVHDIKAGKKANVKTAAVLTGYQSKSILEEHSPDFILKTLDDIFQVIPL